MYVEQFLDAKEVTVGDKTYKISRIPALKAHGIYSRIVRSVGDLGKLGMTMLPEDITRELFGFCAAKNEAGGWTVLDTEDSINTYLPRLIDLIALQLKMVEENFGFFEDGRLITLLGLPAESKPSA